MEKSPKQFKVGACLGKGILLEDFAQEVDERGTAMVGSKCGFLQMQGTGRRGLPWNRTSCAVASPQKPAMPFTGARTRTQSSCLGVTRSWFPYPPQPSHDPPSPISIEPTVQGTLAPKPPYRVRVPAVVDAFRVAPPCVGTSPRHWGCHTPPVPGCLAGVAPHGCIDVPLATTGSRGCTQLYHTCPDGLPIRGHSRAR